MMVRLWAVARKEFLQLRRDRLTFAMMVVFPLMQLMLFGYAINTDIRHIPSIVVDQDQTQLSRQLRQSLENSGYFRVDQELLSSSVAEGKLVSGETRAVLVIPRNYAQRLKANQAGQLQLLVDGSDPQNVAAAQNALAAWVQGKNLELLTQSATGARPVPLSLETSVWFNPNQETSVFVVPGLVGVILTMTMVMLTSMAIARERERGTLEQLVVSPLRSAELMVGKLSPYVLIGYIQMSLILLAGNRVFQVSIVGSLPLLYAAALLFISANLAIGLLFSTLARTQQQAMQMSFFFLLPNILLSGFMFPFEAMPRPAQALAELLPLTHFHRIVRGIVLRGAEATALKSEFLALLVALVVVVSLASLRFKKRLD